jgi:parvulin-like peptidyl-prolyl isomerase
MPSRRALVLAALLCAGVAASAPARAEPVIVNRVVAVVGGEPITLAALRRRARPLLVALERREVPAWQRAVHAKEILRQILEKVIDDAIFERAAKGAGIEVSPAEVSAAIDDIAKREKKARPLLMAEWFMLGYAEEDVFAEYRRQLLEAHVLQHVAQQERWSKAVQDRSVDALRAAWIAAQRRELGVEKRLASGEGAQP